MTWEGAEHQGRGGASGKRRSIRERAEHHRKDGASIRHTVMAWSHSLCTCCTRGRVGGF